MINQTRNIRSAKPVVDVDYGTARRAAVQRSEECRNSAETGAVADRRWDGEHGHRYQAGHHARQGPLHTGDDDDHARRIEACPLAEQPMQSGDADVVETLD